MSQPLSEEALTEALARFMGESCPPPPRGLYLSPRGAAYARHILYQIEQRAKRQAGRELVARIHRGQR